MKSVVNRGYGEGGGPPSCIPNYRDFSQSIQRGIGV